MINQNVSRFSVPLLLRPQELTAELTAAFLCSALEISNVPRLDHAQYVASWLKVLKADDRAVFTAASKASQAVQYLNQGVSRRIETYRLKI